jgi:hypothetical protein
MDKPSRVIEMSMRENDCSGCNGVKPAKPICPAIYHDPGVLVLNQQCTMASVPGRTYFDLAACAEKREFKHSVFAVPVCQRALFFSYALQKPACAARNSAASGTDVSNAGHCREHIVIWQSLALRQIKTSPSLLY